MAGELSRIPPAAPTIDFIFYWEESRKQGDGFSICAGAGNLSVRCSSRKGEEIRVLQP